LQNRFLGWGLALETKKDTDEQLHAFRKQISRFAELNIEGKSQEIHYNTTDPASLGALENKGD
jgi:hypothetical protein